MKPFYQIRGLQITMTEWRKNMNRKMVALLVATAVVMSGTSLMARGYGKGDGNNGRGSGNGYMYEQLNLSDAQQDKMFKISQDYRQKFYDNRDNPVKLAELRAEKFKAMYAVLTKEQQAKLTSEQRGFGGRGGCFGGGGCW